MRIRTIKPEFFTHEGLYELEKESGLPIRIAFAGLWCVADKAGRFKWEPRRIGVSVMPYDGIDFSRVLDALFTGGFLQRYRVEGVEYGAIPSFARHQFLNNKEKESILPEPSLAKAQDATKTRDPRDDYACNREGKGKEVKERIVAPSSPLFESEEFAVEWNAFVKHRKQIKKPLTDRAMELTLRKLEQRPDDALAGIQMVIEKGWQSIEWEWFDKNKGRKPADIIPIQTGEFLPDANKTPREFAMERLAREEEEARCQN